MVELGSAARPADAAARAVRSGDRAQALRHVALLVAYAVAAVGLGSLLGPLLYWAAQASSSAWLRDMPLQRFVNRGVIAAAVLLLLPLLWRLGIRGRADFGLAPSATWRRELGAGAVLAALLVTLAGTALLATGALTWIDALSFGAVAALLLRTLLTGAVVAVFEETFFRGALLALFRRNLRDRSALVVVSMVFAAVHVLKPHHGALTPTEVRWWSGLAVWSDTVLAHIDPLQLALGLAVLFVLAWLLGESVLRSGSLFFAIGVHGGFVFALRTLAGLTDREADVGWWIGQNLRTGLGALLVVSAGYGASRLLWRRWYPTRSAAS